MPHDIYLRTVPHTGTRFVVEFLNYLGVKHQQWHFGWPKPYDFIQFDDKRVYLDNVPRVTGSTRYVITVRNPHHTWESLDSRTWGDMCYEWYDELVAFCATNELVHLLSLDAPDQQQALADLAEFCGVEYDGDFTWEEVSPSGCVHGDIPGDIKKQLSGAYQWYEDHTTGTDNGRHEKN